MSQNRIEAKSVGRTRIENRGMGQIEKDGGSNNYKVICVVPKENIGGTIEVFCIEAIAHDAFSNFVLFYDAKTRNRWDGSKLKEVLVDLM